MYVTVKNGRKWHKEYLENAGKTICKKDIHMHAGLTVRFVFEDQKCKKCFKEVK
jgi:hypothetical protein